MKALTLKMEGRSGCSMEIIQQDESTIIRKYSSSQSYNERLLKQADKQSGFSEILKNPVFKVPSITKIHKQEKEGEPAWFEMEFIHADKYSNYLEKLSIKEINALTDIFTEYFDFLLADSKKEVVEKSRITNKLEEIDHAVKNKSGIDYSLISPIITHLRNTIPDKTIPSGRCHGDFTLSNMLFTGTNIYLIDFLDSFIESPLIDIVKLRQDTQFKWSLMLETELPVYQKNKIIQVLDYMDFKIQHYLEKQKESISWYSFLQQLNFLRILPYVHSEREIEFVQQSLITLTKKI